MSTEDLSPTSPLDNTAEQFGRLNTDDDAPPRTDEEYGQAQLTLRAIVSSKEAGVIIGKAGANVADLRDKTGVRAGVSKVVPGVHDRVLTVLGPLEGIAQAYGLVADGLLKGAPQVGMGGVVSNPNTHRELFNNTFVPAYGLIFTPQPSVFLSHTIRWVPSSAARVSRSSRSKTLPEFAWLHRRKCFHSLQSVLSRSREHLTAFKRLFGRLADA